MNIILNIVSGTPLAWICSAHAELTATGLAWAISQLVLLRKMFVLKRLSQFHAFKNCRTDENWFFNESWSNEAYLKKLETRSTASLEKDANSLFKHLSGPVQKEDMHFGNLPTIGEYLEKDSQVRHYMRSHKSTTSSEAHRKSKKYIWEYLCSSWSSMQQAVYRPYNELNQQVILDFSVGVSDFAKALHTIEDSYSPAHVMRLKKLGTIQHVWYWGNTKNSNEQNKWPGHAALDDPYKPLRDPNDSRPQDFFEMGKEVTKRFILCVLTHLDRDKETYARHCGIMLNTHFCANLITIREPQ